MKKTLIVTLLTVAAFACSRKTIVLSNAPAEKPEKEISKEEMPPAHSLASRGQVIYGNKCGECHRLKNVSRYTASDWEEIMKSMARKAKLTAEENQQVTAYVLANARK